MNRLFRRSLFNILVLGSSLLLVSCTDNEPEVEKEILSSFLINFDEVDLKRMDEFIARFHDEKGDYLMAIPPYMDGGYTIYDIHSDGRVINVRIDTTRDIYSDQQQRIFVCDSVIKKKDERYDEPLLKYYALNCEEDGKEKYEEVMLFSF
jgi:hypothetical protein